MSGTTVFLWADEPTCEFWSSVVQPDYWATQPLDPAAESDGRSLVVVQWSHISEEDRNGYRHRFQRAPCLVVVDSASEELDVLRRYRGVQVCRSDQVASQLTLRLEGLGRLLVQETGDPLTGLANRAISFDLLDRLTTEASSLPLWVTLIDLDHFKAVNTNYGHNVGDQVLQRTARLLRQHLADAELMARFGGEEFLLVWRGSEADLRAHLERINSSLAIPDSEGTPGVTFSAGMTTHRPPEDYSQTIGRADQILYQAKSDGRNRVLSDGVHDAGAELTEMEAELRDFENRVRVFADRLVSTITSRSRRMVESAQAEADRDGLTGLFTRRYFDRRLERELERSRRFSTPLTLILLDLDDFGAVNRNYGYPAGDMALRKAAEVLLKGIRVVDWAGRYGGEELCGVFPDTDLNTAREIAERLREALTQLTLSAVDGRTFGITGSLGIVQYAATASTAAHLIQRASDAVRVSKTTGKNRVTVLA